MKEGTRAGGRLPGKVARPELPRGTTTEGMGDLREITAAAAAAHGPAGALR